VIKSADYIIDLGPEGGEGGGRVVACGTPEEVARVRKSHTGQALRPLLNGHLSDGNGGSSPNGKAPDGDGASGRPAPRGRRKDAA
jgi:excinuclease ABC subunit A